MKLIAFLLSILIFTLSVIPCTDGITCDDSNAFGQTDQHDHSQDTNDLCTPFCTCACCGVLFATSDVNLLISEKIIFLVDSHVYYESSYSNEYFHNVWHPPSLS